MQPLRTDLLFSFQYMGNNASSPSSPILFQFLGPRTQTGYKDSKGSCLSLHENSKTLERTIVPHIETTLNRYTNSLLLYFIEQKKQKLLKEFQLTAYSIYFLVTTCGIEPLLHSTYLFLRCCWSCCYWKFGERHNFVGEKQRARV